MKIYNSLFLLALLYALGFGVHAASVHKWVDEFGVTHYSDQAPNESAYIAKKIEVSNVYVSSDVRDDYYSVTNQWARMREERLERKKLQLEKAALRQQAAPVPQVVYISEQEDRSNRYYPSVPYGYGFKRHNRFHHYANKKFRSRYVNGFSNRYRGSNCKLPRRGNSRFRGSGLTLRIR